MSPKLLEIANSQPPDAIVLEVDGGIDVMIGNLLTFYPEPHTMKSSRGRWLTARETTLGVYAD
ncbi:hypothetical protein [Rhodococcus qingshengii]|uniref:hypothetical protein n=1 Tax=Rhodococcus qingshengii TaxID=334542 RepID=UPI0018DAE02D|nr:hypothetical protein [Rhodococcus qingshengii]QPG90950.1 hypothetical protein I1G86_06730 [Rhodococcus qingshengii]